jgi:hypothetical protein
MSFEEQLVQEINEFRTNPKKYAKKVEKYIGYFKGKTLMIPGTNMGMKTQEGAEAFKEAVDYLSKLEPVEPFTPSKGCARISKDFLEEVQKIDPSELDKINIDEIMQKYGAFVGSMNRELDLGNETPEQIVMSLITSDGDATRSHRDNLLSTELKKIGVAHGKHDTYRFCTVIVFCTKFNNKVDSDDVGYIDANAPSTKNKNEEPEGQTLKPKKVVLNKPAETAPPKENEEIMRDDVVSEKRNEKVVEENGKKLKIIKITRTLKDGSKEVETIKKEYVEGEDDD